MRTTFIHHCMTIALVACLFAVSGWAAPWDSARQPAHAQAAPEAAPTGDCAVYTWGDNTSGQLADGRVLMRLVPHQVTGIGPVSLIGANSGSSLVLQTGEAPNSGTLLTWGYGTVFSPDGRMVGQSTPQVVMTADGVKALVKGSASSFVLMNDGTVWSWGVNYHSSLGDGTTISRLTPAPIPGLSDVKQISNGIWHFLVMKQDGSVWGWGPNGVGQVGDGTTTNRSAPVRVTGLDGVTVTAVSAGGDYSLALTADGTVLSWGLNQHGQLGDGTTASQGTPAPVSGLSQVVAISAGEEHSLALRADGTVWAWGNNNFNALGQEGISYSTLPLQIPGLSGVKAIVAQNFYNLILKTDGTVWAWGANFLGQLGDGTTVHRSKPVQVSGLSNVTAISDGLALRADGSLWAWGSNNYGELGDGSTLLRAAPAEAGVFQNVASASVGGPFVRLTDGSFWGWGSMLSDPSADANGDIRALPERLALPDDIIQVSSMGGNHLALKADGTVWEWGAIYLPNMNLWGSWPISQIYQVSGLTQVKAISSGGDHLLALKQDGTVWAWGMNQNGQLGDGTTTGRSTPAQVSGLSEVKTIIATGHASMALKQDGTVWTWGYNTMGRLGDGSWLDRRLPVQVAGLSDVVGISMYYHGLAVKRDGTVWAWGSNQYGELGISGYNQNRPVQVPGLSDIVAVSAADDASAARQADGSLWTWGRNHKGQLGDGTITDRQTPQRVLRWTCAESFAPGLALVQLDPPPYAYNSNLSVVEDTPQAVAFQAAVKDDRPLTYTILSGPAHGTLAWHADHYEYQPAPDYAGPDSLTFTASDGRLTSAPAEVRITVSPVNDAPRLAAVAAQSVTAGDTLKLTITASDPEGDAITYGLSGSVPAGAKIDPALGVFVWQISPWQPDATYTFTVTATDNGAPPRSGQVTFEVTVRSWWLFLPQITN